jgi:hypothetical protein
MSAPMVSEKMQTGLLIIARRQFIESHVKNVAFNSRRLTAAGKISRIFRRSMTAG